MKKLLALVLMAVVGVVSLPVSALVIDGVSENLVAPFALLLAVGGAGAIGLVLPLTAPEASSLRKFVVGAAWGIAMLAVGVVGFFLALNGLSGA